MFVSKRRAIVVPQREHARLSGQLAAIWGNREVVRLPVDPTLLGLAVALHDRGYPPMDEISIGEFPRDIWLETQARGFAMTHPDPTVDLIVLAHLQRLVSFHRDDASIRLAEHIRHQIDTSLVRAGLDTGTLADIDTVTRVVDMISFHLCFEESSDEEYLVYAGRKGERRRLSVATREDGEVRISPWPLSVPVLSGFILGYHRDGYPDDPIETVIRYRIQPE
jgi:hypothetical protein